jgi:hypothetical protein
MLTYADALHRAEVAHLLQDIKVQQQQISMHTWQKKCFARHQARMLTYADK